MPRECALVLGQGRFRGWKTARMIEKVRAGLGECLGRPDSEVARKALRLTLEQNRPKQRRPSYTYSAICNEI